MNSKMGFSGNSIKRMLEFILEIQQYISNEMKL